MGNVDMEKKLLRKEMLKKRDSIAPPNLLSWSDKIVSFVVSGSKYVRATDILLYSSYGSEVITKGLCEKALKDGKEVFYPKVEGDYMSFYRVTSPADLNTGYKGILEPYGFGCKFKTGHNTVMIVPGVAFGRDGYRVGYGKGYYDKFLGRNTDIYKIGICFDQQLVTCVPRDEYDIQMDEIITEKTILTRNGKGEARWV